MNEAVPARTSAAEERAYLDSWRPRRSAPIHEVLRQLADNEFVAPERYREILTQRLQGIMAFSAAEVSYWRDIFKEHGFDPRALSTPEDLAQLPLLSRADVRGNLARLQPPAGLLAAEDVRPSTTTGSTGLPVTVMFSAHAQSLSPLMWQRFLRWARVDLSQRLAQIRVPKNLFRNPDGSMLEDGKSAMGPRWQYVGDYFETGDEVHFGVANPRELQLDWLRKFEPAYLVTYPGLLEELALANGGEPLEFIKTVLPISAMLTQAMRARIEQTFQAPLHQAYGFNEMGIVATRCAAGRYHTNLEVAWMEVVDEQGQPVPPGRSGHLVATSLANMAMPLFRYDTGDIATACSGPCPCGRTLPGFQDILGRHVRFAGTPPETRPRLNGLLAVLSAMPNELFANILQYQVHQAANRDFAIHVATRGPLHPEFGRRLQHEWARLNETWGPQELRIVAVDEIPRTPSGKQLDFVSWFHQPDREHQQRPGD